MWWWSVAWATECPEAPTWGGVLTDDGAAQVIVQDGDATCWWTVNDQEERRLSKRWEGRRPVALAAWGEAGVAIVLEDPEGWRLYVATDPGTAERIGVALPAAPAGVTVLPGRRVELRWRGAAGTTVWVVDVPREKLVEVREEAG